MADIYMNLSRDEYKFLEEQLRSLKETVHGEGTPFYHKSFAFYIAGIRFEFHGPAVKARQIEAGENASS